MIVLTRSFVRLFRSVVRRLLPTRTALPRRVCIIATHEGLQLRCTTPDVLLEWRMPGDYPAAVICLPLDALTHFEGADSSPVTLRRIDATEAEAHWQHRGIPQTRKYTSDAEIEAFPNMPQNFAANAPSLLEALDDAMQTAAIHASKYAIDHVQLKGGTGEIVGTDTRQVLCQSGFRFPWSENILIPRFGRIASKEFLDLACVEIGKTDTHVVLKVGTWTFCFRINTEGRFPPVEDIIPRKAPETRLRMDAQDIAALVRSLPEMPGAADDLSPVTVDLNGHAAIRARAYGEKTVTELLLNRSVVEGKPVRFCIDRSWLKRAGQLGFDTLGVFAPNKPVLCVGENRKYLAMVLDVSCALASSPNDVRVNSASVEKAAVSPPKVEQPATQTEAKPQQSEPLSPAKEETRTIEPDRGTPRAEPQAAPASAKRMRSSPQTRESPASKGEPNIPVN